MVSYPPKTKPMPPEDIKKRDFFFGTSPDLPKVVELDLNRIRSNPDQPRQVFAEDKLKELASSIEREGLLSPIIVKRQQDSDSYVIVAGERRFRAHQMLNRQTIFAFVTKSNNPDEIALIENLQRENLNPVEEAAALARLMESHGYTHEELGRVLGKARNTVSAILKLNTLPETIKRECPTSDNISKSLLIEIAQVLNEQEQLRLWEQVKQGGLTVKTARQTKKTNTAPKQALTTAQQLLAAGRGFVRHLRQIDAQALTDPDQRTELTVLRREIDTLIDGLEAQRDA